MEVKAVFKYQYGTRVHITTFGPHNKHDNCFFEGRNLDKAYFSIAMYGCNSRELIDVSACTGVQKLALKYTRNLKPHSNLVYSALSVFSIK